jgi:hypothetical protein
MDSKELSMEWQLHWLARRPYCAGEPGSFYQVIYFENLFSHLRVRHGGER